MIIQFVPSLTNNAHAPSVAGRIAVPAAVSSIGATFEAAEITVCACIVFTIISRPLQVDAVGSVIVIVPARLQIMYLTPFATV